MKCATKTLPVRRSPGATFGRCVSRKNYRYCEITFCGSIGRADMIAFTASWMMISSNVMPRNALTMALSSSLISRTAWCAARRSSIRPINPRIRCLRSLSASRRACDARASAAIAEARSKGYHFLRITTGAQNQAMRALASKFGAHLTFRHGESTGSIDLKQHPQPELARYAIATPAEAVRAIVAFNRAYWKLFLRMYGWGRTA